MQNQIFRPVLACVLLIFSACSSPPQLSGYLYAFTNSEFTVTDLHTGKIIAHVSGPQGDTFRYAAKIDDQTILLAGNGLRSHGRRRSVTIDNKAVRFMPGQDDIWIYYRDSGVLKLYPISKQYSDMRMPIYVPKYKSLIFYCGNPGVLCRLSLSSPNDVSIVDANGNHGLGGAGIFDGYFPIVKVSDEEVVYVTDNNIAKYYDISTGQVGYLPLGECAPQLWRSKTKQLLCFAFQPKSHYFLINLDGRDKAPAPHFDGMPAIYLPDYDTVLADGGQLKWDFPDPVPYEWSILRSYSLTNSGVHDFGSGSWVYQGGTVWFQSVPNKIPGMSIATTVQSSK